MGCIWGRQGFRNHVLRFSIQESFHTLKRNLQMRNDARANINASNIAIFFVYEWNTIPSKAVSLLQNPAVQYPDYIFSIVYFLFQDIVLLSFPGCLWTYDPPASVSPIAGNIVSCKQVEHYFTFSKRCSALTTGSWHLARPVTVRESEGLTKEASITGHAWDSCPPLMPQLLLPTHNRLSLWHGLSLLTGGRKGLYHISLQWWTVHFLDTIHSVVLIDI